MATRFIGSTYSDSELKKIIKSRLNYLTSRKIINDEREFYLSGVDDNRSPISECEYIIQSALEELVNRRIKKAKEDNYGS